MDGFYGILYLGLRILNSNRIHKARVNGDSHSLSNVHVHHQDSTHYLLVFSSSVQHTLYVHTCNGAKGCERKCLDDYFDMQMLLNEEIHLHLGLFRILGTVAHTTAISSRLIS